MTKIKNLKVQTNIHEKADAAAANLEALATQVATANPVLFGTNKGNLPAALRKTPHAIDKVVVVDNGTRRVIMKHFKNKSLGIRSKASSLTEEFEKFYSEFVFINDKQNGLVEGETVNRIDDTKLSIIDKNLIASQPWHSSNRFDSVDLLAYRAALINDNPLIIQGYNQTIFDRAVSSIIPTKYLKPVIRGNVPDTVSVNNIIICAPHLDDYTAPQLLTSVEKLFGTRSIMSWYSDWTDERWIDGSIELRDEAPGKDVVFEGGVDHDAGVATMLTYNILIAKNPEQYESDPLNAELLLVTFFSAPVVSTQIGYEALLTSQVIEENGWDNLTEWPQARSRTRAMVNFKKLTERFVYVPGSGDEKNGKFTPPIYAERKVVAFGDLSLVVNRLQAEAIAFYKDGGAYNLEHLLNNGHNQWPAIYRKVFGKGVHLVDVANLYRAYSFFAEHELPGFVQNLANKNAEKVASGHSCCNQCDEMNDLAKISCSEYKIRAAIRSALDFKINQMFDGYRTGNTLLRAFFVYHNTTVDMAYASDIRAELIRIACRNIHDLYAKGYYARLGASASAFRDNYFRKLMGAEYTSPIKVLLNYNPISEPGSVEIPIKRKMTTMAIKIPPMDMRTKPEYRINKEHKIDIHYGYEKLMRGFMNEFLDTVGPVTKELGSTVIAY